MTDATFQCCVLQDSATAAADHDGGNALDDGVCPEGLAELLEEISFGEDISESPDSGLTRGKRNCTNQSR